MIGVRTMRQAAPPVSRRPLHAGGLFDRAVRGLREVVKNVVFFLYLYGGYPALRDLVLSILGRSRVVIVCYHRVGLRDGLSKPVAEFRRELACLRRNYDCITLGELFRRLRRGEKLRRRCAVVTFDDGYLDNYTQAVPALLAAGVPATFFVATGFIGTDRVFPHDRRAGVSDPARHPKMTWNQLRIMQQLGFEIGSHTVSHANLGQVGRRRIRREVERSLADLQDELGFRPRAFSFPWGRPSDVSAEALRVIERAGYYAAVGTSYGQHDPRATGFPVLRRVDVGNGQLGRLAFRARLAGLISREQQSLMVTKGTIRVRSEGSR